MPDFREPPLPPVYAMLGLDANWTLGSTSAFPMAMPASAGRSRPLFNHMLLLKIIQLLLFLVHCLCCYTSQYYSHYALICGFDISPGSRDLSPRAAARRRRGRSAPRTTPRRERGAPRGAPGTYINKCLYIYIYIYIHSMYDYQ